MSNPSDSTQQDITVMVVDDHAIIRSGIAAIVNAEPGMRLIAEASTVWMRSSATGNFGRML